MINLFDMFVPSKVKRELKRRGLTVKNGLVVCPTCGVGCGQCSNGSMLMRSWKQVAKERDML